MNSYSKNIDGGLKSNEQIIIKGTLTGNRIVIRLTNESSDIILSVFFNLSEKKSYFITNHKIKKCYFKSPVICNEDNFEIGLLFVNDTFQISLDSQLVISTKKVKMVYQTLILNVDGDVSLKSVNLKTQMDTKSPLMKTSDDEHLIIKHGIFCRLKNLSAQKGIKKSKGENDKIIKVKSPLDIVNNEMGIIDGNNTWPRKYNKINDDEFSQGLVHNLETIYTKSLRSQGMLNNGSGDDNKSFTPSSYTNPSTNDALSKTDQTDHTSGSFSGYAPSKIIEVNGDSLNFKQNSEFNSKIETSISNKKEIPITSVCTDVNYGFDKDEQSSLISHSEKISIDNDSNNETYWTHFKNFLSRKRKVGSENQNHLTNKIEKENINCSISTKMKPRSTLERIIYTPIPDWVFLKFN